MQLPKAALSAIQQLNSHGFEAYAVGGAVRDLVRGLEPDDVDITTNASPEQILQVFADFKTIPTGLQHGTVTVLIDRTPFEITTYRTDGTYSDGRHPDNVTFTTSLTEDLARRDFTINAMAYHPQEGLVDPYGGMDDLHACRLRCVGDAHRRFSEDALRMARLIRFMSVLSYDVEDATLEAARTLCDRLDAVAAERKRVELIKMLCGNGFYAAAMRLPQVMTRLVPPLARCVGFAQHNPHHSFDVYEHTIRAVASAPADPIVRLALLFHDVGKPDCFFRDDHGIGHFYGHPAVSARIAKETLTALRFDNATIRAVLPLVKHHDCPIPAERKIVKRRLSTFGADGLERLLTVKAADAAACHADSIRPAYEDIRRLIAKILEADDCLTLSALAVNGQDLLALGYPKGPMIGNILQDAFDAVLSDTLENEHTALIDYIKGRWPL